MKKFISIITLVMFLFSQTSAYGQQIGPASIPSINNVEIPRRTIKMERTTEKTYYENDKEKAMIEAVFEAEYKQAEATKEKERLREPMRGEREKEIIERYKLELERKMEEALSEKELDLRQERPVAKKELKKIRVKKEIPRDAELGSGITRKINERIYPYKISGEYQLAWGYDWGDKDSEEGHAGMWKNADFNKANSLYKLDYQYVFGPDRMNTYDKRIYDRFRLKIESVKEMGLNVLSEVVVDPWSFVGKTDSVVITAPTGQQVPVQLRYWSNTQSTIDERIWLTNGIDFVNIPEIKVNDGSTHQTFVRSTINRVVFDIPPLDINRDFRPLRKLEVNYKSDNINFKMFPLADQDHVYTSDDPLVLSNTHIYWEPSAWLNNWEPALYFPTTGDFRRGRWANGIAFNARDSDFNFLTLLRGLSFEVNFKDTYLGGGIATPLNLWQDYDSVNSLPGVLRFKQTLFKNYYVGAVYTYNYGFSDENNIDAFNQVIGIDTGCRVRDFLTIRAEYARSIDRIDRRGHDINISEARTDGEAFRLETKGEFFKDKKGDPTLKVGSSFTHMGDNFKERLSNYRNTRADQFWGKHIRFEPISPDVEAFRIGNGIDEGRNAYNFRLENILFGDRLNSLFDMRFVRETSGGNIEDVYREEITIKPISSLITKFLFRYQDMASTTLDRDSFIIADDISGDNTGEFVVNDDILEGDDASVWTYSGGFHYDPLRWLGVEGIYERTNDYGTFPQRCFNEARFRDLGDTRELEYYLYGQPLMAIPPYNPYDIYKARLFLKPFDNIRTKLEYVINRFKHASGMDDNISHYGVEVDIDITKKLTSSFKYIRSQIIDPFVQQQDMKDVPFHHHDNIFAQLSYAFDENNTFILQFGEFFTPPEFTAIPWVLTTVDTQKIVRFYLKGKF